MTSFTRSFAALFALALLVVGAQPSSGNTIFSQAVVNNGIAYTSDFGNGQQQADNFSLASGTNLVSVRWWGAYLSGAVPATSNFQVRLFNAAGSVPAINPFYDQAVTNVAPVATALTTSGGKTVYEFFANVPTVALAGSTTYFLSLVENSAATNFAWSADGGGSNFFRGADGNSWTLSSFNDNMAFTLSNPSPAFVPLPPAAWAGLALMAALGVHRLAGQRSRAAEFPCL
jgi:hypothetical protein